MPNFVHDGRSVERGEHSFAISISPKHIPVGVFIGALINNLTDNICVPLVELCKAVNIKKSVLEGFLLYKIELYYGSSLRKMLVMNAMS